MNYLLEAEAIKEEIIALRQQIHRCPELGNNEYKTAALVEGYLQGLGIETRRIEETGVVGVLNKGRGPVVCFRADMDALPVTEKTGASFASKTPGLMHACGHDVHTAALLGAAKLLSSHKEEIKGEVRFLFQMDEEGDGGAKRLIAGGALDGASAIFGCHVDPSLASGQVGIKHGKFYAASDMFDIFMKGKSAHGASPKEGCDALACSCAVIEHLDQVRGAAGEPCIVHVGALQSGTARNIVAEDAHFSGILRSLGPDSRKTVKDALKKLAEETGAAFGCQVTVQFKESYCGIVNTEEETVFAEKVFKAAMGEAQVVLFTEPRMTTEDFGYYIEASSGCFYHVGAGSSYPLHSSCFLPDDNCLITASGLCAQLLHQYLEK